MDPWIESQKNNKIGSRYANASFENSTLLPSIVQQGKDWIKSRNKTSLFFSLEILVVARLGSLFAL